MFLIFLILVASALVIFYLIKLRFSYWKDRRVPGPDPTFFIGNIGEMFMLKKSLSQIYIDVYNKYQGYPFVGIFKGITPCLVIREPDFIKNIVTKDFKSFYNNDNKVNKRRDPLLGRNPFVLKNEEWKSTRSKLTPCFTSGKMKFVFPLVQETSKNMVNYIVDNEDSTKISVFEAKELCMNFTLNSVASCAFGVDGKCFKEPNSEFKQLAIRFMSPGFWTSIKLIFAFLWPQLMNIFQVKVVPKDVDEKLKTMVEETLQYREEHNIIRNDFLHMMGELHKKSPDFTMDDVAGQAASFFIDGYETSSTVMSFVLYEIAKSKEAQANLRDEIEKVFHENGREITFEVLNDMKYLEAVIQESLRKYPPLLTLGKVCNEKYTYSTIDKENFKDLTVTIEPGTSIILPIGGLQLDEKYFEEPQVFKPERFLNSNRESITKYSYMPFGEGLRACLGQRFGVLQIKVALVYLVSHFDIAVNQKTKEPLKFDELYFLLSPKGGIWLNFQKIK